MAVAGHISLRTENRWDKLVLECRPRLDQLDVEQPQAMWNEDLKMTARS